VVQSTFLAHYVYSRKENDEKSCFIVTGHILNKTVEVGVIEGFIEKGIPFLNSIDSDFLIFTGDVVLGGMHGRHRFPLETISRQYNFFIENVLKRIETKVYCIAGNHDTGHVPHAPSVELFETLLNPLHFSFTHKGSLFLFLSLYQPFYHVAESKDIFPLKTIWEEYDTLASRTFLNSLRNELSGSYDHIFIFIHASPISDIPLGYYWTHFLIPLLSSLRQDIHVFSTNHYTRSPLYLTEYRVVKYKNIRFYNFAVFPVGSYVVHFDESNVRVDLMEGEDFIPTLMQEVDCQATTRLSMLRRYLIRRIGYPIRGKYNDFIYFIKRAIKRLRMLIK
jgi:hypothetical protein